MLYQFLKRLLDLFGSGVGLILLLPLGLLLSAVVWFWDGKPIFFGQTRIGQFGRPFRMWKFRTMVPLAELNGPSVTGGEDPRITRLGRFLRKTKLDELPQLWNVFIGQMSLVGPRPEVPQYVQNYTPEQRSILNLKPGITDPASVVFRNEEELLRGAENLEDFYRRYCLPKKLELNRAYAAHASLARDLGTILRTIAPGWLGVLLVYAALLSGSFWVACQTKSDFHPSPAQWQAYARFLPWLPGLQLVFLFCLGQVRCSQAYFNLPELSRTVAALALALAVHLALAMGVSSTAAPDAGLLVIDLLVSVFALSGVRLALRLFGERHLACSGKGRKTLRRVALVGAGNLAMNLAVEFARSREAGRRVVAFFDDDPSTWHHRPHNIPVIGMPECLLNRYWSEQIDEVVLALPKADARRVQQLTALLKRRPWKVTVASGWLSLQEA